MLPQIRDPLIKRLQIEPDAYARHVIVRELAQYAPDDEVVLEALIQFAGREGSWIGRREAFDVAVDALQTNSERLDELLTAAVLIGRSDTITPNSIERSERRSAQNTALMFLLDHAEPGLGPAADVMWNNLTNQDSDVRKRVHQWLASASVHPTVMDSVIEHLESDDVETRNAAANIMGRAAELAKKHGEAAWSSSAPATPALVLVPDPADRQQSHDLLDTLDKALTRLAERLDDERAQNHIYNELIPLIQRIRDAINAEAAASLSDLSARRWRAIFDVTKVVSLAKGLALGVTALGGADEAAENVAAAAASAEHVGQIIGETVMSLLGS